MTKKKKVVLISSICIIVAAFVALTGTIVSLQKTVNNLSNKQVSSTVSTASDSSEIHEIYDDTAVVEAYKNSDSSKLNEKDRYVLDTASNVIKDIIQDKMTDYEKEKTVYDWLFHYATYDESSLAAISDDNDNYTPYGVLKSKKTICVGNATTFKLFMDMMGIDCKIIHSTANGEHAWNMVKIDDEWYHVDLTMDTEGSGNPQYNYFNVPDAVISTNGSSYDTKDYPAATSTKDCYIYTAAAELKDVYQLPAIIKKAMDNKEGVVYLRYKDLEGANTNMDITNKEPSSDSYTDFYGANSYIATEINYINARYFMDSSSQLSISEEDFGEEIVGFITISEKSDTDDSAVDYSKLEQVASKVFAN